MTARILKENCPPGLMDGMIKTEITLKKCGISLQLIELVKYRVSQINGCGFCLDMHHREATAMGETELRLHTLIAWRECPYFTPQERAALQFAEELTVTTNRELPEAVYHELAAHFSEAEIIALTLVVTQINSWNRINRAFGTVPGTWVPVDLSAAKV